MAQKKGIEYRQFSMSNQGFFYRSDQWSFARYDIPSLWISAGEDDESGEKKYPGSGKQVSYREDEYDPGWTLEGMKQTIRFALLLLDQLNRMESLPQMKSDLSFPIRK